jgi:uncharacterized protein DUF4192
MPRPIRRPSPARTPREVVRLTDPADLLDALPYLVGFHPRESVVVLSLRKPRGRVAMTTRVDLPDAGDEPVLVAELVRYATSVPAHSCVVVVYTEEPDADGDLPRQALVESLGKQLADRGRQLRDAVLVRDGRWWSYTCSKARCCPPDGRPLNSPEVAQAAWFAAAATAEGTVVLPDRESLAATLAPVTGPAADAMRRHLAVAERQIAEQVGAGGLAAVRAQTLALAESALECPSGVELTDGDAARLVVGVADLLVRDMLLSGVRPADRQHAVSVWSGLTRRALTSHGAQPATIVAWLAYSAGNGALAGLAAEHARSCDPDCSGAVLVLDALAAAAPPRLLRGAIAGSRREVRARWAREVTASGPSDVRR